MSPVRYYTYEQVANRIGEALGTRPAISTLRAASAARGRGLNSRVRITADMPEPAAVPEQDRTVFRAVAIDRWLAHHPSRRAQAALKRLTGASVRRRPQAVQQARVAGLSWQQIAAALGEADGRTYSRQWAQQRYGPGTTQTDSETR